jgi:hypothetical protein
MYINSPGGVVTAGLAIYDTMQVRKAQLQTAALQFACSHKCCKSKQQRKLHCILSYQICLLLRQSIVPVRCKHTVLQLRSHALHGF